MQHAGHVHLAALGRKLLQLLVCDCYCLGDAAHEDLHHVKAFGTRMFLGVQSCEPTSSMCEAVMLQKVCLPRCRAVAPQEDRRRQLLP